MSEVQPTQGRITFKEDGDANHYSMLTEDGRWWLAILANGEQTSARQVANFRRLAACWNACEGIDTDMLEGFSPCFLATYPDRVLAERRALEAQRDELLGALEMVRDADVDCKRDGLATMPFSARYKIDSAIAKATKKQP